MSSIESRIRRVQSNLTRKKAWKKGYLDEMVDAATRLIMNDINNKGRTAQVEFLLKQGFGTKEIIKGALSTQQVVVNHLKKVVR